MAETKKTETPTSQITMAWSDLGRRFMLPKNIAPIDPHLQIESHGGFEEEMQQINNLTCNTLWHSHSMRPTPDGLWIPWLLLRVISFLTRILPQIARNVAVTVTTLQSRKIVAVGNQLLLTIFSSGLAKFIETSKHWLNASATCNRANSVYSKRLEIIWGKSAHCLILLLGHHMVKHLEIGHTLSSGAKPQKLPKGHDFVALVGDKHTIIRKTPW